MYSRSIKLLLLACLTYWVTGAALYVHERIEHSDKNHVVVFRLAGHTVRPPCDDKHSDKHDHDDCPTCQLLTHMAVAGVTPPTVICLQLPSIDRLTTVDCLAPVLESLPFSPIRGPPALGWYCRRI